jgi:hypothetical protein
MLGPRLSYWLTPTKPDLGIFIFFFIFVAGSNLNSNVSLFYSLYEAFTVGLIFVFCFKIIKYLFVGSRFL